MKLILQVCLTSALLAASVSGPTSYAAGTSDHRVEDSLYAVTVKGDPSTSAERVNLLWVFRCAEIANEQGKIYVSLNEAGGKEISKPYQIKRQAGFGTQTGWDLSAVPQLDGVYRPSDGASFSSVGHHTTIIQSAPGAGQHIFVHEGLARLFADPPPLEAGVTYKAQVLIDALSEYAHGDPKASPPALQSILASARVVTPIGHEYALAQLGLRSVATRPSATPPGTDIGIALLHANWALPGAGSWISAGAGYVADGSVVKSDGRSVTFVAAIPVSDAHYRFERVHVDCARATGGVVVGLSTAEKPDVTAVQLAALVDTEATMSSLDPTHHALADEGCTAAGYTLGS